MNGISALIKEPQGFAGSPVVKTSPSNAEGANLIPSWGAKASHMHLSQQNQNIRQKQYCKFSKDFKKNGPY